MFVRKKLKPKFNLLVAVVTQGPDATALQLRVQYGKTDIEIYAVVYTVTTHQAHASFAALSLKTSCLV